MKANIAIDDEYNIYIRILCQCGYEGKLDEEYLVYFYCAKCPKCNEKYKIDNINLVKLSDEDNKKYTL